MKKILFLMVAILPTMLFTACSDDDGEEDVKVQKLPQIDNISLNYHPSEEIVSLPRDIESEGCIINLKDNSYWITKFKLSGKTISFNVLENSEIETGHRFDTIVISYKNERIGAICVTQARKPISTKRLVWALSNAMYRNKALCNSGMSGLEVTKAIYNLSKTTNGKDSYKNYPAFAYCIEMNHDPENNMEWHLPSENEIRAYAKGQSYKGTPLYQHNYWWSSSENSINGNAYYIHSESTASIGAVSKGGDWWVIAFKNGKMEE